MCYVEEALSTLYASSCDGAVLDTKAAPMEQQQASQPPYICSENSPPPFPAPSLSPVEMLQALLQRSGMGWAGHLRIIWEANCSCRAAGYPESSFEELKDTWGDGSACSGLPSSMDTPTRSQSAARESATELLQYIRQLAGLVWPDLIAAAQAASSGVDDPTSYADWEMLQAELLSSPPSELLLSSSSSPSGSAPAPATSCSWGEALWCCNPTCTNQTGPSELALKTSPCGGGCGVRYCSLECQAQGWRDGHKLSCRRLRDRRGVSASAVEVSIQASNTISDELTQTTHA